MPPTASGTGWRRNLNRVTTPKLPPPPRIAQNRSGSWSSSTTRTSPSAVTISAASRLSMVEPVLPHQVADAATGRDPAETDRAGVAEPGREAELRRGDGVLRRGQAAAGPGGPRRLVDLEAVEVADVEHDAALGRAVGRSAVAAGPDREVEAGLASEPDHRAHVVGVGDPHDHRGPGVDAAEHDRPGGVVLGVVGPDHGPRDAAADRIEVELHELGRLGSHRLPPVFVQARGYRATRERR